MIMNNPSFDLSFVSTDELRANLATALASMGQSLRPQKLDELVARVQGFESRNHKTESTFTKDAITLLCRSVEGVSDEWGDGASFNYAFVTISAEVMRDLIKARSGIKHFARTAEHGSNDNSSLRVRGIQVEAFDVERGPADFADMHASELDTEEAMLLHKAFEADDSAWEFNHTSIRNEKAIVHAHESIEDIIDIEIQEKCGTLLRPAPLRFNDLIAAFEGREMIDDGDYTQVN
jgi:hypothetical protein